MKDYFLGCVVHCCHKGGNSQAEQQRADTISNQQLQIMQQQLGMVDPTLQSIISAGGMLPQTQSALTSIAMNSLPAQYQNLTGQLGNQLVQRGVTGGGMAGGGDIARTYGALGASEANQQSNLLSDIQVQKAQGLNQALGMGLGLTGMFNQGGLSALQTGQQAAGQADQASSAFWGSLFGGLSSLGGSVAGAACPAIGSMILMADGSEKAVELLIPGDRVMGIDGESCTIEEIPYEVMGTICVTFDDGHVTVNSPTHAFALPKGGFTVSAKSKGKQISTDKGISTVLFIQRGAIKRVFNIITDGSHTYRADGVWALGVGDAERHIPMRKWEEIGKELMVSNG